ncbi:MAG: hypothetical protein F6K14_20325 [Symploca sp. SIO2C1]|nr:hypothetical protein [Symploca sp. SIO2C1]
MLPVVFKRNSAGEIERICLNFVNLYKRPRYQSLRFWLTVVLASLVVLILILLRWGGLLGVILAFIGWQMLKKN